MKKKRKGYIYIFTNTKSTEIIKIGQSTRTPNIRAQELNKQTGTYGKYEVFWSQEVEDCEAFEKISHYFFRAFRTEKEFFLIDTHTAKRIIELILANLKILDNKVKTELKASIIRVERTIEVYTRRLRGVERRRVERNGDKEEIIYLKSKLQEYNNALINLKDKL